MRAIIVTTSSLTLPGCLCLPFAPSVSDYFVFPLDWRSWAGSFFFVVVVVVVLNSIYPSSRFAPLPTRQSQVAKQFCGGVEGDRRLSPSSLSNVSKTPAEKFTSESALSVLFLRTPPPSFYSLADHNNPLRSVLVRKRGSAASRGSAAQSLSLFNLKAL